jgi:hypothetical protein
VKETIPDGEEEDGEALHLRACDGQTAMKGRVFSTCRAQTQQQGRQGMVSVQFVRSEFQRRTQ